VTEQQFPPQGPPQTPPNIMDQMAQEQTMRFFKRVQDNPAMEGYGNTQALHRFQIAPDRLLTERFDRNDLMWIDDPLLVEFTGIGGAENYIEIDEAEANTIITGWMGEQEEAGATGTVSGQEAEEGPPTGTLSDEEKLAFARGDDEEGTSTGTVSGEEEMAVQDRAELEERTVGVEGILRRVTDGNED